MSNVYEDALDSITWYNGLAEIVSSWKDLVPFPDYKYIPVPDDYGSQDGQGIKQLQIIWMIAVILFGDYGTSPRYGWIENVEGFKRWVARITETWSTAKKEEDELAKGCE